MPLMTGQGGSVFFHGTFRLSHGWGVLVLSMFCVFRKEISGHTR